MTGNEKVLGVFPYSVATSLEMEGTERAQKSRSRAHCDCKLRSLKC